MKDIELTILIPCYNEEDTIGLVIENAKKFLSDNKVKGEVLVVDNNSKDHSRKIASKSGARVVFERKKGYGNALISGSNKARGKYVIMGDADCSYDFYNNMSMLEKLREGNDLVMGNRFAVPMEKGAMSFSHKYIGNPALSCIGRILFRISVKDFHCGLRGYNREKMLSIGLEATGMDYASEMVIKSKLNNFKIAEVPIKLYKDKRVKTCSQLRTIRDGLLHLKLMFRLFFNKKKIRKNINCVALNDCN